MKTNRFQTFLGAAFVAVFLGFCLWQQPGLLGKRLSAAEVDRAVNYVERTLPFDPAAKPHILRSLRAWAEADDGQPVYMLNLMRLYDQVRPLPGAPAGKLSPQQSNQYYEERALPMLLKSGGYALYAGNVQGSNLIEHRSGLDQWSRVLLVRYASRRAFLELLTDPAYAPIEPYKMAALELILAPTASELIVPDLRVLLGGLLLCVFLAVGWWRSARAADRK